ncbi:MAG TPA: protein kinase, partial [Phototrophicaceae bacterium]|nr:protein kinase [Phototrophicaceae bacterium]
MQGIDGYHLVRRIGAGGMGSVHEALDADGNRVAVKVLHESIAADPAARDRLRREVELLHRVRGQGVARVLDAEVDGVTAFVVTELVDGPTLEDDVREHGPLDAEELGCLAHGLAA